MEEWPKPTIDEGVPWKGPQRGSYGPPGPGEVERRWILIFLVVLFFKGVVGPYFWLFLLVLEEGLLESTNGRCLIHLAKLHNNEI